MKTFRKFYNLWRIKGFLRSQGFCGSHGPGEKEKVSPQYDLPDPRGRRGKNNGMVAFGPKGPSSCENTGMFFLRGSLSFADHVITKDFTSEPLSQHSKPQYSILPIGHDP